MLNKVYYYSENPDLTNIKSERLNRKDYRKDKSRKLSREQIYHVPVYLNRLSDNIEALKDLNIHPFPKDATAIYEYEIDLKKNRSQLEGKIDNATCGIRVKELPEAALWNTKHWKTVNSSKAYNVLKKRREDELSVYNFNKYVDADTFMKNKVLEKSIKHSKVIADLRTAGTDALPLAWLTMNEPLKYKTKIPVMLNMLSNEECCFSSVFDLTGM